MNNPRFYVWFKNRIIQVDSWEDIWAKYPGCFYVDTLADNPVFRYGKYAKRFHYITMKFKEFPPEFQAHLLLLGIT